MSTSLRCDVGLHYDCAGCGCQCHPRQGFDPRTVPSDGWTNPTSYDPERAEENR